MQERQWSRRIFFGCVPALARAATRLEVYPSEMRRLRDLATEFDMRRLTDPRHASLLPKPHLRAVSSRNSFLVFSSDRTGSMQGFRMDLKTGEIRQIIAAAALDPETLCLTPDEHAVNFFDGRTLKQQWIGRSRERTLYEVPTGWERAAGFGAATDGLFHIEKRGEQHRIQRTRFTGANSTVIEAGVPLADPIPRPRRAGLLYRRSGELWLIAYDGTLNRPLKTADGPLGQALWSADGRTVHYLSFPPGKLHQLRDCVPDTNEDKLVAATSQFAGFARNSDSTVFVGASANRASAHILLLLRVTQREMTLCEHRASDPAAVVLVISPNSQRLYFQTDREGKAAIYEMALERFVEQTREA